MKFSDAFITVAKDKNMNELNRIWADGGSDLTKL